MADDLSILDATAQAELIRSRRASPGELVEAAIGRIERMNHVLNAVIHPDFDGARARVAGTLPDGPFRGVPFLMKDLGGTEAGRPYHAGMRLLRDAGWVEREDAHITRRLRAAGFVLLGRTNTPELALLPTTEPLAHGATRNPWDLRRSPGGSSGGAAAAVAAGLVPAAHGSDGGGSIRGPASACGLVGLKTTRGRTSFGPGMGERWSGFSVEFPLTRSVRDAAALLDVVAGPAPGDPYVAPSPARRYVDELATAPGRLRIGVLRGPLRGVDLHPECAAAVAHGATLLAGLGHAVEDAYPEALDDPQCVSAYVQVVAANTARALEAWGERVGRTPTADDVEILTWTIAQMGRARAATDHLATLEYVHAFGRRLAAWWEGGFDLLCTPTQAQPPAELGWITSTPDEPLRAMTRAVPYGVYTFPFNMSGQPAISLPLHWAADGLPIGVQLVAPFGREDVLLRVAAQLEAAAPWASRRPPVHATT